MRKENTAAVFEAVPNRYLFPVVIVSLLVATTAALVTGLDWIAVIGVVALAIVSLAFGALQRPSDFYDQ